MTRENQIDCPISMWAKQAPERQAISSGGQSWTYAQLHAAIWKVQTRLVSVVQRGSRIAIPADRSFPFVTLFFACLREGVVVCPVNPDFPVAYIKKMCEGLELAYYPELLKRREKDESGEWPRRATLRLDQPATTVLTSGSSGSPKGVQHSIANHIFSSKGAIEALCVERSSTWLLSLPVYHVGGLAILFRSFVAGGQVRLPVLDISSEISKHRITHVSLVSTQLQRLLQSPPQQLGDLEVVLVGGGPTGTSLISSAVDAGLPIYKTYGMTESSSMVTSTGRLGLHSVLESSGKVLTHREIRVTENGQIRVGGPTIAMGYVTKDGLQQLVEGDGYFSTGDVGEISTDGDLIVRGRLDNMFISGGENIFPEEIETEIDKNESVIASVVVAVDSKDYGWRPVAFVRTRSGVEFDTVAEDLRQDLETRIPRFKIPDAFFPWREELVSNSLKVDRGSFLSEAERLLNKPG